MVTRVCQRYRFSRSIAQSPPDGRYHHHDYRPEGADDDRVEDRRLVEGNPPEVAERMREEAWGGHCVRWEGY